MFDSTCLGQQAIGVSASGSQDMVLQLPDLPLLIVKSSGAATIQHTLLEGPGLMSTTAGAEGNTALPSFVMKQA